MRGVVERCPYPIRRATHPRPLPFREGGVCPLPGDNRHLHHTTRSKLSAGSENHLGPASVIWKQSSSRTPNAPGM